MIRKTALLCGIAMAWSMMTPAYAHQQVDDAMAPSATGQDPEPRRRLTLTPGVTIRSANGSQLGQLVGVRNGVDRQELTVRDEENTVRIVGLRGIRLVGQEVIVDTTYTEFLDGEVVQSFERVTVMRPTPAADAAVPYPW